MGPVIGYFRLKRPTGASDVRGESAAVITLRRADGAIRMTIKLTLPDGSTPPLLRVDRGVVSVDAPFLVQVWF